MGNLTDAERPTPPKPAYVSMPAAVAAAIQHGNALADIRLTAWADTYSTTPERIKDAWDAELSRRSLMPTNSYDVEGK
jgi:hypothetical protein